MFISLELLAVLTAVLCGGFVAVQTLKVLDDYRTSVKAVATLANGVATAFVALAVVMSL